MIETLSRPSPPKLDLSQLPLRVSVKAVYQINQVGTVVLGVVSSGVLAPGMECQVSPAAIRGVTVGSLRLAGKQQHFLEQVVPPPRTKPLLVAIHNED